MSSAAIEIGALRVNTKILKIGTHNNYHNGPKH